MIFSPDSYSNQDYCVFGRPTKDGNVSNIRSISLVYYQHGIQAGDVGSPPLALLLVAPGSISISRGRAPFFVFLFFWFVVMVVAREGSISIFSSDPRRRHGGLSQASAAVTHGSTGRRVASSHRTIPAAAGWTVASSSPRRGARPASPSPDRPRPGALCRHHPVDLSTRPPDSFRTASVLLRRRPPSASLAGQSLAERPVTTFCSASF